MANKVRKSLRLLAGLTVMSIPPLCWYGLGKAMLATGLTDNPATAYAVVPFLIFFGTLVVFGMVLPLANEIGEGVVDRVNDALKARKPSTDTELRGAVSVDKDRIVD